jgi:NodT family efflux transporter outer membrane factor (OMF) lipoprotein
MNVTASQVFPVQTDLPDEWLSLLGCGITTGVGCVHNVAKVQAGSSIAVFGLGHLGQWMVQAARIANARQIIAVDPVGERRELAGRFGATHTVDPEQSATIPPLQQQLRQSTDALAILTGQAPELLEPGDGTLDALTLPAVGAGLPSQLLARRPDVAEAEAQLVSANANIAAARAAFFPSINLTAGGGFESTALGMLLSPENRIWDVSAGVTQTIFDHGALSGQYQYSRARYDELLSDYHKTVLTALGNVEDALVSVQQSAELQLRQQDATDKARRAFEFAQLQFQAGTTDVLTMLNTETALFTAQDALVQGKFAHTQALLTLYQALGGGWHQEQAR